MFLLAMLVVIVIDTSVQAVEQAPSLGVSPVHAFTTLAITLTAVVGLVGGALTVAVAAVAVGPAWLVASALHRVGSTGVQLAVWTVFGALTGLLVVGLSALLTDDGAPTLPEIVVVVVVAAASVDYGWWRVSRSRRRPLDDEGVERAE